MRFWRTLPVFAIATLWVVAGQHCRLELLSGLEFLSCCQHPETEQMPVHHEDECAHNSCAAVESGSYQQIRPQQLPAKPLPGLVVWLVPLGHESPAYGLGGAAKVPHPPPELSRIWSFLQRASLPPRAPSFVS